MARIIYFPIMVLVFWYSGCYPLKGSSPFTLAKELEQIAVKEKYWPGFNPISIPLAVYDGTDTYLFRHPSPPDGFLEWKGAHRFEGRHSAMVANSSADIGGISTATVLLNRNYSEEGFVDLAALALHEVFHVFQRSTHPNWAANEVNLLTYPVADAKLLLLRLLETEAIRRAFTGQDTDEVACWLRHASKSRLERFGKMDPDAVAYERGIELWEGLATYVQFLASGRNDPDIPPEGFGAEEVRLRAYRTGLSWALMLDRFHVSWKKEFEANDKLILDLAVAEMLENIKMGSECKFTAAERTRMEEGAREVVGTLQSEWVERRSKFLEKPGWQLVVEAEKDNPLWPKGFDPLNLLRVEDGLLHTRYLRLGNESGSLEVLEASVLTESAGPHPLFTGVRRLLLTGLKSEPDFSLHEGKLVIQLPTFSAEFRGADVEKVGKQMVIRLGKP